MSDETESEWITIHCDTLLEGKAIPKIANELENEKFIL
jgi:hypothetical protein